MRNKILGLIVCPFCKGSVSTDIERKVASRIVNARLSCEGCGKNFYIENGITYFKDFNKKIDKNIQARLRRTTLQQEVPRKWLKRFSPAERRALEKEFDLFSSVLKKKKLDVHLDFATGTGRLVRELIAKTKGEVVVLDFGKETCLELRYFLKKIKRYSRVSIICADARNMPFKKNAFDSISSWTGLNEPGMDRAIKEVFRVLKLKSYIAVSGVFYPDKKSKSYSRAKKWKICASKKGVLSTFKMMKLKSIVYKELFRGTWQDSDSYLPVFGDVYVYYFIKASK